MYFTVFQKYPDTGEIRKSEKRGSILPPADFCVTKCVKLIMGGLLLIIGGFISILIFSKYINVLSKKIQ